jgi:hypothetical protein
VKPGERPFVVGRRTRKGTTVLLLQRKATLDAHLRGPWTVRAVVTAGSPK